MLFTYEELKAEIQEDISLEQYEFGARFAQEYIEKYCGIKLEQVRETIEISNAYVNHIIVKSLPLVEVVALSYVPEDIGYTTAKWGILFEDYVTSVRLEYVGGYDIPPTPIKYAGLKIARLVLVKTDKPFPSVETLSSGGVSMRFVLSDILNYKPIGDDLVDSILNAYRVRFPQLR